MSLLVVGADHGGFQLKEQLKKTAEQLGWLVKDVGTHGTEAVDYPDFAQRVALEVLAAGGESASGDAALGLMIDGAGVGSAMAACKVPGIRAAACSELYTARNAREHNHANLLCLGSQVVGPGVAQEILRAFLTAKPQGDRHERRVNKIREIERGYSSGAVPADLVERIVKIVLESVEGGKESKGGQGAKGGKTAGAAAPAKASKGKPAYRPVLSERDVLAADRNRPLLVAPGTLITPQARDTARALGLKIKVEGKSS